MMRDVWKIEPGKIENRSDPGFIAKWMSGDEALSILDAPCWSSEGETEVDSIHLYSFAWTQAAPDQETFDCLMREAVAAIDRWINRQM